MKSYFDKHLFKPIRIGKHPDAGLSFIVVIPCFNEPSLIKTLHSLHQCEPAEGMTEVIIVLNAAEDSSSEIREQNEKTYRETIKWLEETNPSLDVFILRVEHLPQKHAGVGLARKIGMDEAAWRFHLLQKDGIIICLDADCVLAPNYLRAIESYFSQNPQTKAASIYFEHPLEGSDAALREGIISYELHLRYYRQALKYAGYPFHYHTIGSSMCVRSDVYQQAGGMNRRKAGEDFYFLHKIMPLGNFGEINSTIVYPEGRISERVPFGTGRAMKEWMNGERVFKTYDFQIFRELKLFIEQISSLFQISPEDALRLQSTLPPSVSSYLKTKNFTEKVKEVNANVSTREAFVRRFLNWFDGFNALKFVHHARSNFYPNIAVEDAAKKLLDQIKMPSLLQSEGLLNAYRKLEKSG